MFERNTIDLWKAIIVLACIILISLACVSMARAAEPTPTPTDREIYNDEVPPPCGASLGIVIFAGVAVIVGRRS